MQRLGGVHDGGDDDDDDDDDDNNDDDYDFNDDDADDGKSRASKKRKKTKGAWAPRARACTREECKLARRGCFSARHAMQVRRPNASTRRQRACALRARHVRHRIAGAPCV